MSLVEILIKLLQFTFLRIALCYCIVMFVLKLIWLQKEMWSLIEDLGYNGLTAVLALIAVSSL